MAGITYIESYSVWGEMFYVLMFITSHTHTQVWWCMHPSYYNIYLYYLLLPRSSLTHALSSFFPSPLLIRREGDIYLSYFKKRRKRDEREELSLSSLSDWLSERMGRNTTSTETDAGAYVCMSCMSCIYRLVILPTSSSSSSARWWCTCLHDIHTITYIQAPAHQLVIQSNVWWSPRWFYRTSKYVCMYVCICGFFWGAGWWMMTILFFSHLSTSMMMMDDHTSSYPPTYLPTLVLCR